MTEFEEALEIAIARRNHPRYRDLCADTHPNRDYWRAEVVAVASDVTPEGAEPPVRRPSLADMAVSVTKAAIGFAVDGFRKVDNADAMARLAICDPCEERQPNGVCAGCRCNIAWKVQFPRETCPRGKWPVIEIPKDS